MAAPGGDPVRDYTPDEDRRLAENLRAVTRLVYAHEFAIAPAGNALLCELHRQLFADVRTHAGRHRAEDFGSEYLTFGPNRSAHRNAVPAELRRIFGRVRTAVSSFDANPDDPAF
ncbi:MAG: hypothetical protein M3154_11655 [Candidatus Eremiobacteraeota bacterium]|nr:hypothetical protein [Candidatus Eremiobacteraeota bacterium]